MNPSFIGALLDYANRILVRDRGSSRLASRARLAIMTVTGNNEEVAVVMLSARDALRYALKIETNGQAFYRYVADVAQDGNVKMLFADLAVQEARHYRTFSKLLAKAPERPEPSLQERQQIEAYLQTLYEHALFGGDDRGTALAHQANDEASALRAAMAFEKDTMLFFNELRTLAPPEDDEMLSAIIAEELGHLRQLARILQDLPWVP